ncbi:DUF402 domain-containing protein [Streptomyces sp. NPDC005438]|uniref:cytidylyl-2-hydroxypropylphosphonate hydrolase n=1 Tax=Streptomyces sp. NPDC005438 TaxID=3156880 RepID=UPI00339F34EB
MTAELSNPRPTGVTRWSRGTPILWRYRANGGERIHICRPVTVVRDTPEVLAVWLAPGTPVVRPRMADGTPIHREPLATRYTRPRADDHSQWAGTGLLKVARPGQPWSVWLFWAEGWRFKNWYVNLEEPLARWSGGVDSEDHFLDAEVFPDRSWRWRDEDEFEQAREVGLVDPATAERILANAGRVQALIEEWGTPFTEGWEDFRPDPDWPVPRLPEDWDRAPTSLVSGLSGPSHG